MSVVGSSDNNDSFFQKQKKLITEHEQVFQNRDLAVAMGGHSRLGVGSVLRFLDPLLMREINISAASNWQYPQPQRYYLNDNNTQIRKKRGDNEAFETNIDTHGPSSFQCQIMFMEKFIILDEPIPKYNEQKPQGNQRMWCREGMLVYYFQSLYKEDKLAAKLIFKHDSKDSVEICLLLFNNIPSYNMHNNKTKVFAETYDGGKDKLPWHKSLKEYDLSIKVWRNTS